MSLLTVCAGDGDIASSVLTLLVIPIFPCFYNNTMSTTITNFGTVNYHDHHKELTIHTNNNVTDIVRSFMAEDVSVEEVNTASPQQTKLPFFVPDKLKELGTYTAEEFEEKYREAVKAGAPQLAKFLKLYKKLEVLKMDGYNKRATYDELKAFFGDDLAFGYPNFTAYY